MTPALVSDSASVPDTPLRKSQPIHHKIQPNARYYDLSGSDDDLSQDYETTRNVPESSSIALPRMKSISSPSQYITQPTQIINREANRLDNSQRTQPIVQVPASSPLQSPSSRTTPKSDLFRHGGLLASALAPPGTAFRAPQCARKAPPEPPVIDISDDDRPRFAADDSSEDDFSITKVIDIKPSAFAKGGQSYFGGKAVADDGCADKRSSAKDGLRGLRESNPLYSDLRSVNPNVAGRLDSKHAASVNDQHHRDDSYTQSTKSSACKRSAQTIEKGISMDDIADLRLRSKILEMNAIIPSATVGICQTALNDSKGNVQDALLKITDPDWKLGLYGHSSKVGFATVKDSDPSTPKRVMGPTRSIHEKWGTALLKQDKALRNLDLNSTEVGTGVEPPVKKRRKLVQGIRRKSPPIVDSPAASSPQQSNILDVDESSEEVQETKADTKAKLALLEFLNTCSTTDLQDFANIDQQSARTILSHRPFDNLQSVRSVEQNSEIKSSTSNKTERVKRPIGDKIVEVCLETWKGFEAIDELVSQCVELGKPVAEAMQSWDFDPLGVPYKKHSLDVGNTQKLQQSTTLSAPIAQPAMMDPATVLKDYQIVGLNWLALLFRNNLSCILADDMGLGKTCQVIAFLAYLQETNVDGPHLVVVPGSTLENWLREFHERCPALVVEPYYGNENDRGSMRMNISRSRTFINVVVTTYDIAVQPKDRVFLRKILKPVVSVYDEAHTLRNSESERHKTLAKIPSRQRILLTGTPLQNNLRELASLLAFLMPTLFATRKSDLGTIFKFKATTTDSTHAALLSKQRIMRAKAMLRPFMLRRKKDQVMKHLPKKINRVQFCELNPSQSELYTAELEEARRIVRKREALQKQEGLKKRRKDEKSIEEGGMVDEVRTNVLMQLRKAAIHPLLLRRLFDDQKITDMSIDLLNNSKWCPKKWRSFKFDQLYEVLSYQSDFELHTLCEEIPEILTKFNLEKDEWMDSGKVSQLAELLLAFKANGDRVLVFSQFVNVLDILEAVLETLNVQYSRFDGSTKIDQRQDLIDEFMQETGITVFLLSTGAGGAGINLVAANKVIIFDMSFNPQQDVQAENRAHRIGQERDVEVIRLVTRGTIEEGIYSLGEAKLSLDRRVAGVEELEDEETAETDFKRLAEEAMWKQIAENERSASA